MNHYLNTETYFIKNQKQLLTEDQVNLEKLTKLELLELFISTYPEVNRIFLDFINLYNLRDKFNKE